MSCSTAWSRRASCRRSPIYRAIPRLSRNKLRSYTKPAAFDDLVVWISPNVLFNRMVAAGKLP